MESTNNDAFYTFGAKGCTAQLFWTHAPPSPAQIVGFVEALARLVVRPTILLKIASNRAIHLLPNRSLLSLSP